MKSGWTDKWWCKELQDLECLKDNVSNLAMPKKDLRLKWKQNWEKQRNVKLMKPEKLLRLWKSKWKKLNSKELKSIEGQKMPDKELLLRLLLRKQSWINKHSWRLKKKLMTFKKKKSKKDRLRKMLNKLLETKLSNRKKKMLLKQEKTELLLPNKLLTKLLRQWEIPRKNKLNKLEPLKNKRLKLH